MSWVQWAAVSMVGVGAVFMLCSIIIAVAMLPRLSQYYKSKWAILSVFKGFFLFGYLAFIIILVMDLRLPVELVTGVVFLGGACFVFLVIGLSKRTIIDLTDNEEALEELNRSLEDKVNQRTGELAKSMEELEREVEERKIVNRKVERMGKELRLILDTISTGIRAIDMNHTITQVNKQFCKFTGFTYEELIDGPCYNNFADGDCRGSKGCRLDSLQQHPGVQQEVVQKRSKAGVDYHFSVTSAPMYNEQGELIGVLEDFQDITALIQAQEEKELAQSRLLQAAKLESVGQLAAGIAHEINTPVQFVASNIDFLKDSFEDVAVFMDQVQVGIQEKKSAAELEPHLDAVDWEFLADEVPQAIAQSKEGMERIRKLVLAMKEFSHPATREMAPADLNRIIENTIMISQNEWKDVATLKKDLAVTLPEVPCLSDEIGQVFLNIIVNAGQAIGESKGEDGAEGIITVSTDHVDEHAVIRISDTGKGMDEALCKRIFDPFFTTKEVGKGTGQGLSIARDIVVNKHGGELTVESTPGEGSIFTVSLPLEKQSEKTNVKEE